MTKQLCLRSVWRLGLVAVLIAVGSAQRDTQAQSRGPTWSGGVAAPRDASFSIALREPRQYWERIWRHRAIRLLRSLPLVEECVQYADELWQLSDNKPLAAVKRWWTTSERDSLRRLLIDIWGRELYVHGDASFGRWAGLLARMPQAALLPHAQMSPTGEDPSEAFLRHVVLELDRAADQLQSPTLVLGGPLLADQAPILQAELARLESLWSAAQDSPWRGQLRYRSDERRDALEWTLDCSQLPWDEWSHQLASAMGETEADDQPSAARQALERLVKRARQCSFKACLGRWDDQLLLVFGQTDWSKPEQSLSETPAWSLLLDEPADPMVLVGYIHWESMGLSNMRRQAIDDGVAAGLRLLRNGSLPKSLVDDIEAQFRQWRAELANLHGQRTASLYGVAAHEDRWEGVRFDWSELAVAPPEGPLRLTRHLGETAWGWSVWRHSLDSAHYQPAAQLTSLLYDAFQRIGGSPLDNNERSALLQVKQAIEPFCKSVDQATRAHLLPGLAGGEMGWVGSIGYFTREPFPGWPSSDRQLPMPSLTLAATLTDADAYRRAWSAYFSAFKRCWTALHENFPQEIGGELALPGEIELEGATSFTWAWPASWDIDQRLRPHAILREDMLFAGLAPAASQALFEDRNPPNADILPEAPSDRLLAAGAWNGPLAADWMRSWVSYLQENGGLEERSWWPDGVAFVDAAGRLGWVQYVDRGTTITRWRLRAQ